MEELKDGRVIRSQRIARETMARIRSHYKKFPDSTISEAMNILKMSYPTVRKYVTILLSENKEAD